MTGIRTQIRRFGALALALLFAGAPGTPGRADDSDLFSTSVAPNVVLMVDNSGSMNEIIWHSAYVPGGPFAYPLCNDTYPNSNRSVTANYTPPNSEVDGAGCKRTGRTVYHDPALTALGNATRWSSEYLKWYYSQNADPYIAEINSNTSGLATDFPCIVKGSYAKYKRSRISAAKDVLREVICRVNQVGAVRFGIAQFMTSTDPNGGYIRVPVNDYTAAGHPAALAAGIDAVDADAWTPLGETLFKIYTYFMSRTAGNLPPGRVSGTFPVYQYTTSTSSSGGPPGSPVPGDPVQYACQKNFVVVITDGEPTKDHFATATPTNTAVGFSSFATLIGDYHADGENETSCPWGSDCALYLDDIAKYMHDKDFRPDLSGDQTVDVYTVGFTTNSAANALLSKTAAVGGGSFYTSNNAEELATAIANQIADIIQKSQAFTAATVPAIRTTSDSTIYTSLFIPSQVSPYWEGHLRSYAISTTGEILDRDGNCAVDDPTPGLCFEGPFLPGALPFWDAGDELASISDPATRSLYTSKLVSGSPARRAFDMTDMAAADLGVSYPPAVPYTGSTATNAEGLTDEIVQNVRGCTFGTGVSANVSVPSSCSKRTWLLGDIFHSNPVVVGRPAARLSEPSYQAFEALSAVASRDRVAYVGANDGFLHAFHAGDWQSSPAPGGYDRGTGDEIFGFMPWTARQNIRQLPIDTGTRDYYFVDGSPAVADVWIHPNSTATTKATNGSEWKTVVMGGLRQGGRSYYALDVTDPASGSYPGYLWEYPKESDSAAVKGRMGETWSEPIITRVKLNVSGTFVERWVAIVGGGYDKFSDPNSGVYNAAAANAPGRGIYMIEMKTGRVLAEKRYGTGTGQVSNMLYAIPSTPAVLDLDYDGFADVVYVGDLGGNVWKWVVHPAGEDSINAGGDVTQPAWPFKKFLQAPSATVGATTYYKSFFYPPVATKKNGRLWLAMATGERANLRFADPNTGSTADNNRMYAAADLDPLELAATPYATLTESALDDRTEETSAASCTAFSGQGYYVIARDSEKFITNLEIFNYKVYAGSFIPTTPTDPCTQGGQATLYRFKIYCGENVVPSVTGAAARRIDIGAGMPTDPRITISTESGGNRVIINQTDGAQGGSIKSEDEEDLPGGGGSMLYWRELP